MPCHKGYLFQHHCIVDSFSSILTPGKGSMTADHNCRHCQWINPGKAFNDDCAGFFFVFAGDFCRGHFARAGDFAVEVICMGRTECRNAAPLLREYGCPTGVGMDDPAQTFKCFIELQVGGGIGRGF